MKYNIFLTIFFFTLFNNALSQELINLENPFGSFSIKVNRYSDINQYTCDITLTGHKSINESIDLLLFNSSNELKSRIDLSLFQIQQNKKIKLKLSFKTFDKSDCKSVKYLKLVKSK